LASSKFSSKNNSPEKEDPKVEFPEFIKNVHINVNEATTPDSIDEEKGIHKGSAPKEGIKIMSFKKSNEPDHSSILVDHEQKIAEYNPQHRHFYFSRKEIKENFSYYFLPNGYPQSVAPGYAKFSILFALSSFSIT
jgi:hypothetical protein